jgi:hypothetical protein
LQSVRITRHELLEAASTQSARAATFIYQYPIQHSCDT